MSSPGSLSRGCSDSDAFTIKKPAAATSSSSGDWVTQFNLLKALLRLLVKYANETLPQPQAKYETPDLHKIAKNADEIEILAFCRVVVAVS